MNYNNQFNQICIIFSQYYYWSLENSSDIEYCFYYYHEKSVFKFLFKENQFKKILQEILIDIYFDYHQILNLRRIKSIIK